MALKIPADDSGCAFARRGRRLPEDELDVFGRAKVAEFVRAVGDVAIEFASETFSAADDSEQKAAFLDSVAILLDAAILRLYGENKVENVSL